MSIKRRDFLKQGAFLVAAASQAGWITKAVTAGEEAPLENPTGPGIETWTTSVCQLCPGGCGIRVRRIDGQPVKIKGNELSPINRGGLCPAGHSGLQVLFNPGRIRTPLKRVGERGKGNWAPITWSEALHTLTEHLKRLRDQNRAHHLAVLDGQSRGLFGAVLEQFLAAYGSPNRIRINTFHPAYPEGFMYGFNSPTVNDFAGSRMILSFGKDFLDSEGPPARMASIFGQLRQDLRGNQVKIVQIDSRLSITAAKADRWVPVNPGTYGALALGIAHILVVENLIDSDFIARHTFGFEDWTDDKNVRHSGFRSLLMHHYFPERVSQITGVEINEIIEIARSFAANRPAIAICGNGADGFTNAFYTRMAVQALNALVGSINQPGGVLAEPPVPPSSLPVVQPDAVGTWGRAQPRADQLLPFKTDVKLYSPARFIESLNSQEPYPVEIGLIIHSNPAFEMPDCQQVRKALQKIPFLVSFSSFMDETTQAADLVLPDHTYLEKWDLDYGVPDLPFSLASLSEPVVEPRFDTRHVGDVFLELARRLGGSIAASLPYPDYLTLLKSEARAIFKSGRGFIITSEFSEFLQGFLGERGFRYQKSNNFDEFWQQFVNHGGWMAPPAPIAKHRFRFSTPSRKFEFYSQQLERLFTEMEGNASPAVAAVLAGIHAEADQRYLPHYEPTEFEGRPESYPLHLQPFSILTLFDGEGANRPMMMEMVGFRRNVRWDSWAEINPETAREHGISEGDWIWIESPLGKIKTRANLFAGAMPGVVYLPLGLGHTDYGKYARGYGANANEIISLKTDPLGGQFARNSIKVKIYKAQSA